MVKAKGKRKRRESKEEKEHKGKGEIPVKKSILTTVLEKARENKEALKYVALFSVFCVAFYLVYYSLTISGSTVMILLKGITAHILGAFFSLVGADVVIQGEDVTINGFPMQIIDECTAVFSSIVYCACVLAYPTTLKNKGIGIAFGVPSLYAINILRLVVLALVGISAPNMFEFVHVYLWQASFIIFVVVIFLLWLKLLEKV